MKRFLRRIKRRITGPAAPYEEGIRVMNVISVEDYAIMRFFNKSTAEWNALSINDKAILRDRFAYAHRL